MKAGLLLLALATITAHAAEPPEPKFRAFTLDDKIQIGYGLAIADVDGDQRPDVLLADKRQIVWYRNPGAAASTWNKFVMAENLTEKDHVCIAAQDIDGDGKCEVAVGAEWNPSDTEKSGAVFYLIPSQDRRQRWTPVKFPSVEPTTHRMRWVRSQSPSSAGPEASQASAWGLVVVPLHGRGNKRGEGEPVKVLLYRPPADLASPNAEWKSEVIDSSLHKTHNLEVIAAGSGANGQGNSTVVLAGGEGIIKIDIGTRQRTVLVGAGSAVSSPGGAGEVRVGRLRHGKLYLAAVEPMHGNELVVYTGAEGGSVSGQLSPSTRNAITSKLAEGHALACGDLAGAGVDHIVVGWRGSPGKEGSTTGVSVWTPMDAQGAKWRETDVDPSGMACEDLQLADLDGDGRLDIIAAGRATRNVKIYFNETGR